MNRYLYLLISGFILIFFINGNLMANEDEVIIGDEEILIENQDKDLRNRNNDENDVIIGKRVPNQQGNTNNTHNTNIVAPRKDKIDSEIDKIVQDIKTDIRKEVKLLLKKKFHELRLKSKQDSSSDFEVSVDKEIDRALNELLKKLKTDLSNEIKKDIRKKMMLLLMKYTQQKGIVPDKTRPIKKSQKVMDRIPFGNIFIKDIRIGSDKPYGIQISRKDRIPVRTIILKKKLVQNAKYFIYAKNTKTGKFYLVYSNSIQFNGNVGVDRFVWSGSYKNKNVRKPLPIGVYRIYCITVYNMNYKSYKRSRFWGFRSKNYYVTIVN